jgi:multiple sugar transport system substrate-binding protein
MKAACDKIIPGEKNSKLACFAGQYQKYEGLTVNFDEAVHGAGGVIVGPDGKPNVATPEATKGLSTLVDWKNQGLIPKAAITWQEEQGRKAFQDGELVFHRNWGYVYNKASQTDGSSKVAGKLMSRRCRYHRTGRVKSGRPQLRNRQVRREQGHSCGLPEVDLVA